MLCCFFWIMDHEKESGRICWMCSRSIPFSVGKLVHNRYISWECKECRNVCMYIVPQWFGPVMWGGVGTISIKKNMADGCGYSEVWTDFIYIFSSKMLPHINMENDIIYFANGYTLCTYLPPSIHGVLFTGLHIHPLTLYKISALSVINRQWEVLHYSYHREHICTNACCNWISIVWI